MFMNEEKRRVVKMTLGLIKVGYWTLFLLTIIMFGSPFLSALIFSGSGMEALPSMSDPEYIIMSIRGFLHCASYLLAAGVLFIVHELGSMFLLAEEGTIKIELS
jgi:hypothetical protein